MLEKLPITSVKKFYFLKYFYILLECVEKFSDKERVFEHFKTLKQKHRLGESKYLKNITEGDLLTETQLNRYKYTLEQVISESIEYKLIKEDDEKREKNQTLWLTLKGTRLLNVYREQGEEEANKELLKYMEHTFGAFRQIIEFLYASNNHKKGLLILPSYRPSQFGLERSDLKTGNDWLNYLKKLTSKFINDFTIYLGDSKNEYYCDQQFQVEIKRLVKKLIDANILPQNLNDNFNQSNYNAITKRIRDFWITYFLKEIYKFPGSMPAFEIWTYRGKQIGIIHATEFYPNFSGRVVYPISVVLKGTENKNFEKIFEYEDSKNLYVHKPDSTNESTQNLFIDKLYNAYIDLRTTYRSYYINLPPLREIVCYNMKISEKQFESLLTEAYKLNLQGKLPLFSISLEVDRKPEETTAMYIKQSPVLIDGQYKNIIGIDMTKGDKK